MLFIFVEGEEDLYWPLEIIKSVEALHLYKSI